MAKTIAQSRYTYLICYFNLEVWRLLVPFRNFNIKLGSANRLRGNYV